MSTAIQLSFRPDIQGLRAIAILLVILAHANFSFFAGGFIGVDVFFVLSGYLITGLLYQEYQKTETIRFLQFLARRLRRLLPALLFMICCICFLAPMIISSYEVNEQSQSLYYSATWTSNLFFAFSNKDYFSDLQTKDLFLHTWSLSIEEQFYLIWPMFILAVMSWVKTSSISKENTLLIALGMIATSSLALSLYWSYTQPLWSFYLMPSRIWQFSLGAGGYLWQQKTHQSGNHQPLYTYIGLVLIFGSAIFMHSELVYPGFWALLPSFGTALIIANKKSDKQNSINKLLASSLLTWIGNRSYSLYLWHWPVLILGFSIGIEKTNIIILLLISLLLSMMSYRLIELPFWKGALSRYSAPITILVSVIFISITLLGLTKYLTYQSENDNREPIKKAIAAKMDAPIIYPYNCDTWYLDAEVRPCAFGPKDAEKTVILLGDSVLAQWFSALPEIFKKPEWQIIVFTKSACPMVDEDIFYERIGKNFDICTQWRNKILNLLSSYQPDVIITGSSATYNFTEKQWLNGSKRIFDRLSTIANQVIIIPGTPSLSFNAPGCLVKQYETMDMQEIVDSTLCEEVISSPMIQNIENYLKSTVKKYSNIHLLSLNDLVCPKQLCQAKTADGTIIFRDHQHLTDSFVKKQIPDISERLFELIPALTNQ
ncbi:acyltransferase family protein [Aliikangiella sp. IMCC44359]|uniref:acyltransferase family protein n=1 Tax=Aliikangiella sp. IMCC44359 TaxID=3459125 RepID=UPI00403AA0CF